MAGKASIINGLDQILPRRVKSALFHLSFNLAPEEFENFSHRYAFVPNMKFGLAAMAKRGFSPKAIIDVGAFKGSWSIMAKDIWPDASLLMVEPNWSTKLQATSDRLSAMLFSELLGAEDGASVLFNVMGLGSSVMNERSPLARKKETRTLRTLDSIIRPFGGAGFLKIDAQGYELEILKGATRTLKEIDAVLLEIAVIEINEGAPLLHEVIAFIFALGFVSYDIFEIHRRPLDMALNQIDIVFVRPTSALLADKRHFSHAS